MGSCFGEIEGFVDGCSLLVGSASMYVVTSSKIAARLSSAQKMGANFSWIHWAGMIFELLGWTLAEVQSVVTYNSQIGGKLLVSGRLLCISASSGLQQVGLGTLYCTVPGKLLEGDRGVWVGTRFGL